MADRIYVGCLWYIWPSVYIYFSFSGLLVGQHQRAHVAHLPWSVTWAPLIAIIRIAFNVYAIYIFTSSWYRARIDRSQGDFLVSWSSTLEIGLTIYDGWMACVGGGGVVRCATDHRYNRWQRRSSGDIVFDPLIKSSRVSAMALRGVPLRFGCGQYQ